VQLGQKGIWSDFKITRRLGVVDEHGRELCLEIERKGRTLYWREMPCPEWILRTEPIKEIKREPITINQKERLRRIQKNIVQLLSIGRLKEAIKLAREFELI